MRKIRSGDLVVVLVGKDRGRQGLVLQVLAEDNKVVVEGVNIAKKSVKADPNRGIEGGIVDKVMPIHMSNVALLNPKTKKPDRVGFRFENGKKIRFFKSTGDVVQN